MYKKREKKKIKKLNIACGVLPIYHIYLSPPLEHDMIQGQFFKRSLTGLNSEFSFS